MTYAVRSLHSSDIETVYAMYEQMRWEGTKKEWTDQIKYGARTSSVITCDGKVIGAALALPFEKKIRIAGVIIHPSQRGHNLGHMVTEHLLAQLKEYSHLELDATPPGKILYEKFHFTTVGTIVTFTKPLATTPFIPHTLCKEEDLDQIVVLDRAAFGASRKTFLDLAFYQEKSPILIAKKQNKITGFILCSYLSDADVRLGPWIHEEEKEAASLLRAALYYCAHSNKKSVSIHVASNHTGAINTLKTLNFNLKETTARMESGISLPTNKKSYCACWSLELG